MANKEHFWPFTLRSLWLLPAYSAHLSSSGSVLLLISRIKNRTEIGNKKCNYLNCIRQNKCLNSVLRSGLYFSVWWNKTQMSWCFHSVGMKAEQQVESRISQILKSKYLFSTSRATTNLQLQSCCSTTCARNISFFKTERSS